MYGTLRYMDRRVDSEDFKARFWAKVTVAGEDQCWLWAGATEMSGYGYMWIVNNKSESLAVKAHRLSFYYQHGDAVDDVCVLHRCDNPPCVNPNHLFPGTRADNNRDRMNKGRNRQQGGSANSNARLDIEQVIEIKALVASGISQTKVGERFGIKQAQVSRIVRGVSWKNA